MATICTTPTTTRRTTGGDAYDDQLVPSEDDRGRHPATDEKTPATRIGTPRHQGPGLERHRFGAGLDHPTQGDRCCALRAQSAARHPRADRRIERVDPRERDRADR